MMLHCLVCWTGKGLEKCCGLSCTFLALISALSRSLRAKSVCKPQGCVTDQGEKTGFVTLSKQLEFRHENLRVCPEIR